MGKNKLRKFREMEQLELPERLAERIRETIAGLKGIS